MLNLLSAQIQVLFCLSIPGRVVARILWNYNIQIQTLNVTFFQGVTIQLNEY